MAKLKYPGETGKIKLREGSLLLVGGGEPFLVEECVAGFRAQAREAGFRVRTLFAETLDDAEIGDLAGGGDLLAEKYLIILRNCRALRQGVGMRAETARRVARSLATADAMENAVVFVAPKGVNAPQPILELKGLVEIVCFPLFPERLRSWIAQRVRGAGHEITPQAIDALVRRVSGDLAVIAAELDKLFLMLDAPARVDAAMIERVVDAHHPPDEKLAGEVANLCRAGRRREALAMLRGIFDRSDAQSAHLIAWHLRSQFHLLLCARAALDARPDPRFAARLRRYLQLLPQEDFRANQDKAALAEEAADWMRAHPGHAFASAAGLEFAAYDGRRLAPLLAFALDMNERELLRIHDELFELEAKMKSGAVDPAAGLELFVALFPGPAA